VSVSRIVPNISSATPEETADFYVKLLGFDIVMDDHSIITLASPVNRAAQINIVRLADKPPAGSGEHPALLPPQLSFDVEDVDSVYADATERGLDIRYPITNESWGVRRFFVSDPSGVVINILSHHGASD
jgi:catechol 2,3-dioxygenase-like lactoylglutathione lyase family enzyme